MHRRGLRLAVGVHFERQVHLHLPLPGVDRPFHDPHQRNIGLADTQAPCRLRGVKRRIGSLLRREYKGNMLRHVQKITYKSNQKSRIMARAGCVL